MSGRGEQTVFELKAWLRSSEAAETLRAMEAIAGNTTTTAIYGNLIDKQPATTTAAVYANDLKPPRSDQVSPDGGPGVEAVPTPREVRP